MKTPAPFLLPVTGGPQLIEPDTLVRVEAIRNYSKLFFVGGRTLVVAKVLRWFDEKLRSDQFIRPHRSHLVNQRFITAYNGGTISLGLQQRVVVSRRKRDKIQRLLHSSPLQTKA